MNWRLWKLLPNTKGGFSKARVLSNDSAILLLSYSGRRAERSSLMDTADALM